MLTGIRDIVDTTPSTHYNLWKMILGAIDPEYHEYSDGEGDTTSDKLAGSQAASPALFSQPATNKPPNDKLSYALPPTTTGVSTASCSLFDKDGFTSAYTPEKHETPTAVTSLDNQQTTYKKEQDLSDEASIYTRATIPGGREYMEAFANDLFSKVFAELPDHETVKRISDSLPNLLRGFALKLGGENQEPINREIMAFIHKKRR